MTTATKPLRVAILLLATSGAGMFFLLPIHGMEWFNSHGVPASLRMVTNPRFWSWFLRFGLADDTWLLLSGFVCVLLVTPLSIVSLLRRDYMGVYGLIVGLPLAFALWVWLHLLR